MPVYDDTFAELQDLSRRAAALYHVASAISASVSTQDVGRLTVERARDAVGADAGALYLAGDERLRLVAACAGAAAPPSDLRMDANLSVVRAARERQPVWLVVGADPSALDQIVPALAGVTARAHASVPLIVDDRIIGVLAFTFTDDQRLSRGARDFLLAMAALCAGAAERTRLHEAERAASAQTGKLQRLASALAGVLTARDVAHAAVETGLEILGAESGGVGLSGASPGVLEVLDSIGSAVGTARATLPIVQDAAYARPILTGEPVFIEDAEAFARDFPPGLTGSWFSGGARVVLPLAIDGQVRGVLAFGFAVWRRFEPADRRLARAIADLCAQALDRARLYELERRARVDAEWSQWRFRILSTASKLLAQTHDWEGTLVEAARLALDGFADWCVADVVTGSDNARRMACVHKDPARRAACAAFEAIGISLDAPGRKAMDSGAHVYWSTIPEEIGHGRDRERNRLLAELGLGSVISSPLDVRGKILGAMTFVRSIPGHPFEDSDVEVADELARRVALAVEGARLYRETDEARARAERAVRARDAVLVIVSHDLMNPLTVIQLAAAALIKRGGGAERTRRYAGKILKNVGRMKRQLDDLLDLGALESGALSMRMSMSDVGAIVADAVEQARAMAAARRQTLSCTLAGGVLTARVDPDRMAQLLGNLIGNAIKYTPEGGHIDVRVAPAGGRIQVEVADDGPGIPADQLEHVFERFWRASGGRDRPRGVGLGLSIAHSIVRAHGGDITASSTPGHGTTFSFAIPAHPAPAAHTFPTAESAEIR